jgi:O-methyltransferase
MATAHLTDHVLERARTMIRGKLEQRGYVIEHSPGSLWRRDPAFSQILRIARSRTLLRPIRCFMLWQCARLCAALPGDAAELGVYKGGSAALIAAAYASANKPVHLFDTFTGMPAPDPARDSSAHGAGEFFKTSADSVADFLADFPNVRIHPGLFPDSGAPVRERRFGFVHVDAVIHQSVHDACEFFYPRMVPGGVMIFDDYDSPQCPGAACAVDSYFRDRPERLVLLPTRQCVVHRLP